MPTILKRKLTVRHGREGPVYDPYAYTEVTVTWSTAEDPTKERSVKLRFGGIGERLMVDGKLIQCFPGMEPYEFEQLVGLTPAQVCNAYERAHPSNEYDRAYGSFAGE